MGCPLGDSSRKQFTPTFRNVPGLSVCCPLKDLHVTASIKQYHVVLVCAASTSMLLSTNVARSNVSQRTCDSLGQRHSGRLHGTRTSQKIDDVEIGCGRLSGTVLHAHQTESYCLVLCPAHARLLVGSGNRTRLPTTSPTHTQTGPRPAA